MYVYVVILIPIYLYGAVCVLGFFGLFFFFLIWLLSQIFGYTSRVSNVFYIILCGSFGVFNFLVLKQFRWHYCLRFSIIQGRCSLCVCDVFMSHSI